MWSRVLATVIYLSFQSCVSCTNVKDHISGVEIVCGSYEAFNLTYSNETREAWKRWEDTPLLELGGTASLHTSHTDLSSETHKCGASLISDRYLLTAAHCVFGGGNFSISLGRKDLDKNAIPDQNTDIYTIEEVIIHPDYQNNGNAYNSIAILKTDRTVQNKDKIWPFCLPEKSQAFKGLVQIAGWGKVNATSKLSILGTNFVRIADKDQCESSWKQQSPKQYDNLLQSDYPQGITDQILCAGRQGIEACSGDDGGPMVHTNNKGKNIVIGVIAERKGCSEDPINTPGFYTNVAHYTDWIYDTIKELNKPPFTDQVDERVQVGTSTVLMGSGSTIDDSSNSIETVVGEAQTHNTGDIPTDSDSGIGEDTHSAESDIDVSPKDIKHKPVQNTKRKRPTSG